MSELDAPPPRLCEPHFSPIDEAEAREIRGGLEPNAGLCAGVGFACNSKGGVKAGLCVIVGVCSNKGWIWIGG